MDKNKALEYALTYAEKVKNACSPSAIFIYGSYINGTPNEESDIDIAVIFDNFEGDFLETSALLYRLTCDVSTIIEPVLLDISKDKSGFANEIIRTGKQIA